MPGDVAKLLVIGVEPLNENHVNSTDVFLRARRSTLQFTSNSRVSANGHTAQM
jgi:hypothetical protein